LLFLTTLFSDKIALNVNADEAAVLGAALYGASLSRQFKTKPIRVSDISVHDIQISYFAAASTANSRPRRITTLIFPAGSKVGSKKLLTFKRKEDLLVFLDYKTSVSLYLLNLHFPPLFCITRIDAVVIRGFPTRMLEVEIGGVAEALQIWQNEAPLTPSLKPLLHSRTLASSQFRMPLRTEKLRMKVWIRGTPDRVRVWRRLKRIPAGGVDNGVIRSYVSSKF